MTARISLTLLIVVGWLGCSEQPARSGVDQLATPPGHDSSSTPDPTTDGSHGSSDLGPAPTDDAASSIKDAPPSTAQSPTNLPVANGPCPELQDGDVTFSPKGIKARKARIWIGSEAQSKDGPLVLYFHGTGMSPNDATWSVGKKNINEITGMGGLVVAPYPDKSTQYPWFISNGDAREDDMLVIDEIVACVIKKVGIDVRRIHATGMSAGGMITCDLALRRANYIASTSPKSGGFSPWNKVPKNAEPQNKSASMVFHGGTSDKWGSSLKYKPISEKFRDEIVKNGGFAFICDHGKGHTVPTDAVDSVWEFFKDHPWNTTPSPYAGGLPSGFPSYCKVP